MRTVARVAYLVLLGLILAAPALSADGLGPPAGTFGLPDGTIGGGTPGEAICIDGNHVVTCYETPASALAAPCLPPGAPEFAGWALANADAILLQDETGTPRAVAMLEYQDPAGKALRAMVLGVDLIGVDLEPAKSGTPVWVDGGWVTEAGKLRAVPTARCQWRQLAGRGA